MFGTDAPSALLPAGDMKSGSLNLVCLNHINLTWKYHQFQTSKNIRNDQNLGFSSFIKVVLTFG